MFCKESELEPPYNHTNKRLPFANTVIYKIIKPIFTQPSRHSLPLQVIQLRTHQDLPTFGKVDGDCVTLGRQTEGSEDIWQDNANIRPCRAQNLYLHLSHNQISTIKGSGKESESCHKSVCGILYRENYNLLNNLYILYFKSYYIFSYPLSSLQNGLFIKTICIYIVHLL